MSTETVISLLISLLALGVSALAVFLSYLTYRRTNEIEDYRDIDTRYNELLALGMSHPDFVNPEKTQSYEAEFQDDKKRQYELFAYMWWNICETIFDRKAEARFWNTWQTALRTADELHGTYLKNLKKLGRFKPEFRDYIITGKYKNEIRG